MALDRVREVRLSVPAAASALVVALLLPAPSHGAGPYDPLRVEGPEPTTIDLSVDDAARRRAIPLKVYLPAASAPAPVVLFSHGLGGSRDNGRYLGVQWAKRGYVAVFLQHAGSDDAVWRDEEPEQRLEALRAAAKPKSFVDRAVDVRTTIDALERWREETDHPLAGRLDTARLGMSGHSFGAITTQAVAGQKSAADLDFFEPRIRAAVAMSPSPPQRGGSSKADLANAFGDVRIPWLLLTGTADDSPIGGLDPEDRLKVFPALPPGAKYELVLDGARHSAFGDRPLAAGEPARNPNHHRAILAVTTAFWDAYLKNDRAALAWLIGGGVRSVLEPNDRWQRK